MIVIDFVIHYYQHLKSSTITKLDTHHTQKNQITQKRNTNN